MGSRKYVELNDALIMLYVTSAMICTILALMFIIVLSLKWSKASDAINPLQYKGRTMYFLSFMIAFIGLFVYSSMIVFVTSNAIINWNYDQMNDIYEKISLLAMAIGATCFYSFTFIPYLQKIQIMFELSRMIIIVLRILQMLWLGMCMSLAVSSIMYGITVSHHHDQSSGVILLRYNSSFLYIVSVFYLPLTFVTLIVLLALYGAHIRTKLNKTKQIREQQLHTRMMEISLISVSLIVFIVNSCLCLFGDTANSALLYPTSCLIMVVCAFFTLGFNETIFYYFCWPFALIMLKCCFCSYQNGDKSLLKNIANKTKYQAVTDGSDIEQQSI